MVVKIIPSFSDWFLDTILTLMDLLSRFMIDLTICKLIDLEIPTSTNEACFRESVR